MPKFVKPQDRDEAPESPEALFTLLRPSAVKYLWSHQADALREYAKIPPTESNVAIELPTGAGKTLVGLTIAEYHRRANRARVAYLCPTKQLVGQVTELAQGYGLHVVAFTGPGAAYDQTDLTAYARSQAVAVSTYDAIFNTAPTINDPQFLVLDDAHAGEAPVASLWAVTAVRGDEDEPALYGALLAAVIDGLPEA